MNKIRIIGGQWRGRKLPVLNIPGLQPTTDSIRETLFNWLAKSIVSSRCLDCFAGTGALGLEALSRCAASATLLDIKRTVANNLKKNVEILKTTNAIIINTNTLKFLAQPGTAYDIVFIDPPFRKNLVLKTIYLLEDNNWLANQALIYVESEVENIINTPANWVLYRNKIAGQVAYRLYNRNI